jgi:broad specificity phosphatase PhoE
LTTLHLIRHGQTDWNLERRVQGQTDSQLTATGRQQAEDIAAALQSIPFSAAYSSSSIRARDTAASILKHHSLELVLRDDMREIHLGAWEGQLYADVEVHDPDNMRYFQQDPSQFKMSGAESFADVRMRAMAVIDDLLSRHKNEHLLLVSHGIWIKAILADIEQRELRDFWRPPQMANCCHSIIEFDADKAKIVQYAGLRQW